MATCGIRKLLDFVFTQRELFWLDDILPGAKYEHPKKQAAESNNEKVVRFNNRPKLISYTPINNNDTNNENNDNSTNTNSNSHNDNETSKLVS